jgi:aspartyl-tRNA(Asn)/glutamyl-tRNA(Gln) amidotransferase subunit C
MITYDELKKIAALAKLSLDGEDMDALARDIGSILDFANQVAEAGVSDLGNIGEDEFWAFRPDEVRPSYPVEDILSNAGEQRDGYFVARRTGGLAGE